jgi:hypothetical protein
MAAPSLDRCTFNGGSSRALADAEGGPSPLSSEHLVRHPTRPDARPAIPANKNRLRPTPDRGAILDGLTSAPAPLSQSGGVVAAISDIGMDALYGVAVTAMPTTPSFRPRQVLPTTSRVTGCLCDHLGSAVAVHSRRLAATSRSAGSGHLRTIRGRRRPLPHRIIDLDAELTGV